MAEIIQNLENRISSEQSKDAVFKAHSIQSSASEIDGSVKLNSQNIKYMQTKLALANSIAIIGDSISHGAFATNIKKASYVSLLKKYILNLFGSKNYGFETISASSTDGIWNSTMIHGMYTVGTWTTPVDAEVWSLNGMEKWGGASSQMFFEIDDLLEQKYFKLNILKSVTSASNYSIYVNNVLKETLGTGATGNVIQNAESSLIALTEDAIGSNHAIIKVVINSGELGISGVTYYNNIDDKVVNNYSQSGRKTENINEYVVNNVMSNNDFVFWNVGHNDAGLADFTKYNQVMQWVYQYATSKKTCVAFCDFLWTHASDHYVKFKMKEKATQLGNSALYIDIPKTLTSDGSVPTSTYLTTTISSWSDVSHPNNKGHRIVFTQIKKALGI